MVQNCSGLINRPQRVLSVLVPPSALGPTYLPCLFCQTPSEHIHYQLSWHIQYTSPRLYAKPEEMLSAQLTLQPKERGQLMNRFHSVAGPSHFILRQQIANNHLFKAPSPLGTSSLLYQLFCSHCLPRPVLHVQTA